MRGSLSLIFDLKVSGHTINYVVNNVSRALVDRLTRKFAGEIEQETDGYDPFKLYEDLLLTEKERANMFREGIQSVNLLKVKKVSKLNIRRYQGLTRRVSLSDKI